MCYNIILSIAPWRVILKYVKWLANRISVTLVCVKVPWQNLVWLAKIVWWVSDGSTCPTWQLVWSTFMRCWFLIFCSLVTVAMVVRIWRLAVVFGINSCHIVNSAQLHLTLFYLFLFTMLALLIPNTTATHCITYTKSIAVCKYVNHQNYKYYAVEMTHERLLNWFNHIYYNCVYIVNSANQLLIIMLLPYQNYQFPAWFTLQSLPVADFDTPYIYSR